MSEEGRALSVRIRSLANRFTAQANGYAKQAARSLQDEQNARRDATWLNEAVAALEKVGL